MKRLETHVECLDKRTNVDKQPYQPPLLTEHGYAKDITLQTFFGTFSPPTSN